MKRELYTGTRNICIYTLDRIVVKKKSQKVLFLMTASLLLYVSLVISVERP
jgi:hypothetical protein